MSQKQPPYKRIEDAPLVCNIEDAARILNRSVRSIEKELEHGTMIPPPIPTIRPGRRRRQWSRYALEEYLKGEYLKFDQSGRRQRKRP